MKKITLLFLFGIISLQSMAQPYTNMSIFAHNDYAQSNPFFGAYQNRVGYIEADIFLNQDDLFVAHLPGEIRPGKTLESLYLIPLQKMIIYNKGWAYPDSTLTLTLMIDLKTEGVPTVNKLVEHISRHKELLRCKTLRITISGNVPDPSLWKDLPTFIHIDGRPGISYTEDQLKRIDLISTNFNAHVRWNGQGKLPKEDREKLRTLIQTIHDKGKKIRFWSAPDFENGWSTLMNLNVDIIGTDNLTELISFIKK